MLCLGLLVFVGVLLLPESFRERWDVGRAVMLLGRRWRDGKLVGVGLLCMLYEIVGG